MHIVWMRHSRWQRNALSQLLGLDIYMLSDELCLEVRDFLFSKKAINAVGEKHLFSVVAVTNDNITLPYCDAVRCRRYLLYEQLPLNAARFEGVSKRKPKLPF